MHNADTQNTDIHKLVLHPYQRFLGLLLSLFFLLLLLCIVSKHQMLINQQSQPDSSSIKPCESLLYKRHDTKEKRQYVPCDSFGIDSHKG
jgi:hypothetical protein